MSFVEKAIVEVILAAAKHAWATSVETDERPAKHTWIAVQHHAIARQLRESC